MACRGGVDRSQSLTEIDDMDIIQHQHSLSSTTRRSCKSDDKPGLGSDHVGRHRHCTSLICERVLTKGGPHVFKRKDR